MEIFNSLVKGYMHSDLMCRLNGMPQSDLESKFETILVKFIIGEI
jgi:hypothetical protein